MLPNTINTVMDYQTIITRAAVPFCLGLGPGTRTIPPRLCLTVTLLSHSLLDSITYGGKGIGWLWLEARFLAPWPVIKAVPFVLDRYFTPYGHQVIMSELQWI